MALAYIALGANIAGPFGVPPDAIAVAIKHIQNLGIVENQSRLYRSEAWPDPSDPEFINAVIALRTDLSAAELLEKLHAIEAKFGRVRAVPNAPRTLDLDIVDYGDQISDIGDTPVLPHPRLADRAFVLLPLAEIAPAWRHPRTGVRVADLIAALPDPSSATPL